MNASLAGIPPSIAGYRVVRLLGRGGMGVVYLADDPRLGRQLAIKVLAEPVARDPERIARIRHEARLLAAVNHPNVATIYGLEDLPDGSLAMILEYIDGETLAERLEAGPIAVAETVQLCGQVAAALEAAHERGVIHRDLKPANIMIHRRGLAKLLDFGLARSGPPPATPEGNLVGTPGYMSPEQVLGLPLDPKTDVFALGCVLYECVTGRQAFPSDTALGALMSVLHGQPDWGALPSSLPQGLRRTIEQCLVKDATQRLADVRAARHQLEAAIAAEAALRPKQRPAGNLPGNLTSFVGRLRELAAVRSLVDSNRLVTLTGPGGCGKTRLALEAAERRRADFPDGSWWVDLAPVSDPERVSHALASALGVREDPARPLEAKLAEALAERRLLVVLDNCEHVLSGCAALAAALLGSVSGIWLIATSRERLGVSGEQEYRVPSLSVSGTRAGGAGAPASPEHGESFQLFVVRARLVRPDWTPGGAETQAVAAICQRLDGLPLAIELAAARLRVLSVDQIQERLADRFRLLASAGPSLGRHPSLRATLDWSYEQLTEDERRLLRALSVFSGGCTLEAAVAVYETDRDEFGTLDLVAHLVDKSLVQVETEAAVETRYRLLETSRQYAAEELERCGETSATRRRHLEFCASLAGRAAPHFQGPGQVAWHRRILADHENILAALGWSGMHPEVAEAGLRVAAWIWPFWESHGPVRVARATIDRLLERHRSDAPSEIVARALTAAANMCWHLADYYGARARHQSSLDILRALGNTRGVAASLGGIGLAEMEAGELDRARALFEESLGLFRQLGDEINIARSLGNLAIVHRNQGDHETSRRLQSENLAIRQKLGDRRGEGLARHNLVSPCVALGDYASARENLIEVFPAALELEDVYLAALALENTSELATRFGATAHAARLRGAAAELREQVGITLSARAVEERDEILDRLRAALGDERFDREWETGRRFGLEESASQAVEWLRSMPASKSVSRNRKRRPSRKPEAQA